MLDKDLIDRLIGGEAMVLEATEPSNDKLVKDLQTWLKQFGPGVNCNIFYNGTNNDARITVRFDRTDPPCGNDLNKLSLALGTLQNSKLAFKETPAPE